MHHSTLRLNPFRTIPVAFALILNAVLGPLAPLVHSPLVGETVMGYVGDASTFELDGNAFHATAHDWDQVYADRNGPPNPNSDADNQIFISDGFGSGDDILTGGNTKDIDDISSWLWKVGSVQDKDDIENAFAAAYTASNGHTVAYFGLDRYQTSGDATAGFWFFKNGIAKTGNGTAPGSPFSGVHAEGDILVVLDYTNGGVTATATVYKWHNGALTNAGSGSKCDNSLQNVCAISNVNDANSPWPYTPKSGTNNVFPGNALFEGGLDLTALGLATGCFSTFMAETRSSQETTATLSDFAIGGFSFCEKPSLVTQVSAASINVGESVTDLATLSGNKGPVTGTVDFFVCGPTQSAQECSTGGASAGSGVTVTNGSATSDPVTANAPGVYCFRTKFTPEAGSKYLATTHTATANECFEALPAVVQITKSADAASVSAGSPIGFSVTVSNTGAGNAAGVTLSDALPGGNAATPVHWVIDATTGNPAAFAISGADGSQQLTLAGQPISLAAGAHLTVHVTAATSSTSCATYDNTASVSTTNDGSDEASASTEVLCPEIQITKSADAASVSAGSPIGFSVTVSNTGAGNATGVTLSDALPGGNAATPVHWVIDATTGNPAAFAISGADGSQQLTLAGQPISLAAGAHLTVHVTAATSSTSCATYDNTASVSTTNDGSDEASASTEVLCPEIQITKSADAASVSAGSPIGFSVTVSNTGAGNAAGVTLSDALPGGNAATPVHWVIDATTGNPAAFAISGADGSQQLTLAGQPISLAAGAHLTVHVTAATSSTSCATYDNTASVSTTNDGSDEASASTEVLCPELVATKTADNGTVSGGEQIGFTIEIVNKGSGDAFNVALNDPLPAGADLDWTIADQPAGDPCSITGNVGAQTLECSFGTLASGTGVAVHVLSDTTAADCSTLHNVAHVTASNNEPLNPQADVTIQCPGLNIAKTAATSPIHGGDTASFTVSVWNVGPGSALNATLDDPLPAGESGVLDWSIDPAYSGPGTCDVTGAAGAQTLACSFGDLPAGTTKANPSASITLVAVTSPADECATLDNTATVSADNNPSRSASASIEVTCPALVIEKSVDKTVIDVSEGTSKADHTATWTLSYTLTDGPVSNAQIVDTIPAGLTYVAGSASVAPSSINGQVLTWDFPLLTSSGTITFMTTVDDTIGGGVTLTNVVTIESDQTPKDDGQAKVKTVETAPPQEANPSVPNTALALDPNGQPIQIPVELMVLFFLSSLAGLTFANVRSVRRRRS